MKSLRPRDTYFYHWTGSLLVEVMFCCLFSTKQLPETMLGWLDLQNKPQSYSKYTHFLSRKCISKCLLQNLRHFVQASSADSRLASSQWETSLQSNAVSHWLGANLESSQGFNVFMFTAPYGHVFTNNPPYPTPRFQGHSFIKPCEGMKDETCFTPGICWWLSICHPWHVLLSKDHPN